jgi:hypothetical protein
MDKKETAPSPDGIVVIFTFLIILAIMPFILSSVGEAVAPFEQYIDSAIIGVTKAFGLLIGLSFPFSVAFILVIIYSVERLKQLRAIEKEKFDTPMEQADLPVQAQGDPALAHRWSTVSTHIESENSNDWKQAILEADIMLDDLLTNIGYRGESVGEKLKRVDPAHFQTLGDAWEAHKVRNQIAHEGSAFALNQIEARRVIQQYRKVFEEFYYI